MFSAKTEELRMLFLGAVNNKLTVHVLAWKCDGSVMEVQRGTNTRSAKVKNS